MSKELNSLWDEDNATHSDNKQEKPDNINDEKVDEKSPTEGKTASYNDLECSIYQNYTASEVFVQGLAGIVNQQDVEAMIRAQKKM